MSSLGPRAVGVTTRRGTFATPCFMPVGTRGAVKYLTAADYDRLRAQIVLGNTYHLMLRPGAEVVARFAPQFQALGLIPVAGVGSAAGIGELKASDENTLRPGSTGRNRTPTERPPLCRTAAASVRIAAVRRSRSP